MSDWLSPETVDTVTRYLDLAGVFACGILGGVVARTRGLDLFGYLMVGVVSGLGGGIIRDTLLQHGTPVALTDPVYLPTAFAGAFLAFLVSIGEEQWKRVFTALDAAVLGFWAVTGAHQSLAVGLGWLPAVLLGTVTAVGGGAVRDLLLSRVPAVFGGNGLYASVAMVVAAVFVVCSYCGLPTLGIVLGVVLALVLHIAATRFGWTLPGGLHMEDTDAARAVKNASLTVRTRPSRRPRPRAPRDDP
ncbi:TRIC cation channel family protein [Streptomyces sp. BE147]|uniref:trimeric intracellular cation channel family protein n=1 Tax=Streptomyces sp. BE147 TaxID=3002524 RepID=UPI002E78E4CF|nr:TRIC cation channel family protein [Streptomyces sp. BE147]MEE1738820.1 TRIC cation channel family protein [Streptomyces sp. BE147]